MATTLPVDNSLAPQQSDINPATGLQGKQKTPVLPKDNTYSGSVTDVNLVQGTPNETDPTKYPFQTRLGADNPELRAQDQPIGQELLYGAGRFVSSTATKFLEGAGYLYGMGKALVTDAPLGEALDNGWTRWFSNLEQGAKDAMPIYHTNKYNQGNILKQMGTLGFWMDDTVDGLAFMASAWLGGAGLEALGSEIGAYGKLAELFSKATVMARTGEVATKTLPAFANIAKSLDVLTLSSFNSGVMASFMAKDTMKELEAKGVSKEDAAKAAKETFWWNFGAMMPSSYIMNSMFFGKVEPEIGRLSHVIEDGKLVSEVKPLTTADKAASMGKSMVKSMFAGAWQMDMQQAISQHFNDQAEGKDDRGQIAGVFGDALKNMGTSAGQKGMMIGALLGILPAAVEGYKEAKVNKVNDISLHNMLSYTMSAVEKDIEGRNIWRRNEPVKDEKTGQVPIDPDTKKPILGDIYIDPDTKKPQIDPFKLAEYFLASHNTTNNAFLTMMATKAGRTTMAERLDEERVSSLAFGLMGNADGIEHFNALIDEYANQKIASQTEAGKTPDEKEIKKLAQEYKSKGQLYKTLYDNIQQAFAGTYNFHTPHGNSEEEKAITNMANSEKDNAMRMQFNASVDQMFWRNKSKEIESEIAKTQAEIGDTELGKAKIESLQTQKDALDETIKLSQRNAKYLLKPKVWQDKYDSDLAILKKEMEKQKSGSKESSTVVPNPEGKPEDFIKVTDNKGKTFTYQGKDADGKHILVAPDGTVEKLRLQELYTRNIKMTDEAALPLTEHLANLEKTQTEETGTITPTTETVLDEIKAREDKLKESVAWEGSDTQEAERKARKESVVQELDNPKPTEVTGAETPEEIRKIATGAELADRYGNKEFGNMNLKTLFDSADKDADLNVIYNGEHGTLFIDKDTNEVVFKATESGKEYILGKTTDEDFFEGDLKASDLGITPLNHTIFDVKLGDDGVGIDIQGRHYLMDEDNPLDAIEHLPDGTIHVTLKDVNGVRMKFTSQALTQELAYSLELLHAAREAAFKEYIDDKGLDSDFAVVKDPAAPASGRMFYIYHMPDGSYRILQPNVSKTDEKGVPYTMSKTASLGFTQISPTLKNGKANPRYNAILKPYLADLGSVIDRVAGAYMAAGKRATEAERNEIKKQVQDEIKQYVADVRSATAKEIISAPGTSEVPAVKTKEGEKATSSKQAATEQSVAETTSGTGAKKPNGAKSVTDKAKSKSATPTADDEIDQAPKKTKAEKEIVEEVADKIVKDEAIPQPDKQTSTHPDDMGTEPSNGNDAESNIDLTKEEYRRGGAKPATGVATQLDDNHDLNNFLSNSRGKALEGHTLVASFDEDFIDEDWTEGKKNDFYEYLKKWKDVIFKKEGEDLFDSPIDTVPIKLRMHDAKGNPLDYEGMYIHKSKFANEENLVVTEDQRELKNTDYALYEKSRNKMILEERKAIRAERKRIVKALLEGKEVRLDNLRTGTGIIQQSRGNNHNISEVLDSFDSGRLAKADSNGTIMDGKGNIIPGRGGAGNVFLATEETANGDERVVKLNVSKIREEHAKILLEAFRQLVNSKGGPKTLYEGKEVKGGLTVGEVIDYLALQGDITNQNDPTKLRVGYLEPKTLFTNKGILTYGTKKLDLHKKLTDTEIKDFVNHITMNKNYNVPFENTTHNNEGVGGKLKKDFTIGEKDRIEGKKGDTYQAFLFRNNMVQTDLVKDPATGTFFSKPILMFDEYKGIKADPKKPVVKTQTENIKEPEPVKKEVTPVEKRKAKAVAKAEPETATSYPKIKSVKDLDKLSDGAQLFVATLQASKVNEDDTVAKLEGDFAMTYVVGTIAKDAQGRSTFHLTERKAQPHEKGYKDVAEDFDNMFLDKETLKSLVAGVRDNGAFLYADDIAANKAPKEKIVEDEILENEDVDDALNQIYQGKAYTKPVVDDDEAPFAHTFVPGEKYEPGDIYEAVKTLRTKLGNDFDIKKEADFIKVVSSTGNKLAFGTFHRDAITLSDKLAKGTEYEEAFHRVSLLYLSPDQQRLVHDEGKIRYKMPDATDREINERMAQEYREMEVAGKKIEGPKTVLGKIGQFFKDLYDFIHTVFTGKLKISNLDVDNLFRVMGASNGKTGRLWYAKPREESYKQLGKDDSSYSHAVKGRDLVHVKNTSQLTDIVKHLVYTMVTQSDVINTKDINSLNYMVARDVMQGSYETLLNHSERLLENKQPKLAAKYRDIAELHKEVVDNYDVYLDLMKSQIEALGIRTILPENPEDETDAKNFQRYEKAAFEVAGRDNAGAAIKLVIATLPSAMELSADTKMNQFVEYDSIFDTLQKDLSELPTFEKMMEVLKSKTTAPYRALVSKLENDHRTDPFDTLSTQFFHAMNKNRYNYFNALAGKKGGRTDIQVANAETQRVADAQSTVWGQGFMMSEAFRDGAPNKEYIQGVQTDYTKLSNLVKKEYYNKANKGKLPSYKEIFNGVIDLFNKVSVPIDSNTLNNMLDRVDPSDRNSALYNLLVGSKMAPVFGPKGAFGTLAAVGRLTTSRGAELPTEGIFKNEQLFKNLVAPSYGEVHGSPTSNTILGPDGNPYYLLSEASYLSDLFNVMRNNPSSGFSYSELSKVNYNEHSYYLKQLADPTTRKKLDMAVFSALSLMDTGDRGRGYKDISDIEDTMVKIALFESGKVPLPQLADRSHLFMMTGLKPLKFDYIFEKNSGKVTIPQSVIDIFYGYAIDEYKQIQRVKSEVKSAIKNGREDKLKENMHYALNEDGTRNYEKANGLKYQHFTEFNDTDYNLDPKTNKDPKSINSYKSMVRKVLENRIDDALDHLADQKIISVHRDGKGNITSVVNKMFDDKALKAESKALFGDVKEAQLDLAIRNKIANFQLNSIMATIESEKMIFMSPAYYKNLDDKIKRYTAIASTGPISRLNIPHDVLPGERLLHDHDNFKTSVLATQKINGLNTPLFGGKTMGEILHPKFVNIYQKNGFTEEAAKAKATQALEKFTSVDPTDGQAYITSDMFRALSIRLGEWTKDKQKAFDLSNSGRDLTKEEQNLVDDLYMQPLKFGYFGPELSPKTASPLYYKMSLATLTPKLVEGTQLQHLYEAMTDKANPIDMVLFDSAVKVGVGPKTPYYGLNEDGSPNTGLVNLSEVANMPIGTASFQFLRRQTLTDPHNELRDVVKTQFRKIALSNIADDRVYKVGDEKMTGKELKEQNKIMMDEMSNRGTKEFLDSIGVDEKTLYTADPDKLSQVLRTKARLSGMPDSLVDALAEQADGERFETDALPSRKWLQSSMLSALAKKAVDLHLPGSSLIQMANFGLHKIYTDKTLKLIDSDGFMEAKVSMEIFRDAIPNYNKLSYEERLEFANEHFKGVGYRVPTQGLVSTVPLKFVDFLPATSTATIVLPAEFTTLTGSDFDIDKLYLIRHNYETVKGKPQSVKYLTDENSSIDKRFDVYSHEAIEDKAKSMRRAFYESVKEIYGKRDDVKALMSDLRDKLDSRMTDETDIDDQSPEYQRMRDDARIDMEKLSRQRGDLSKQLEERRQNLEEQIEEERHNWKDEHTEEFIDRDILHQNTKAAIENRLVDSYLGVLTANDHVVDTHMPLDASTQLLKNIAKEVTDAEGKDRDYPSLHTASFIYQSEVKHKYLWGKKGVGPFARANVHHILGQIGSIHLGYDLGVGNTRDFEGEKVTDLSQTYGQDKESISNWLSALINAHVDIAKDAYIFDLNVNNSTYSVGELLIRAGAGGENAFFFLAQPILKDYAQAHNDSRGKLQGRSPQPLKTIRKLYKTQLDQARQAEKIATPVTSDAEVFDVKRLKGDISSDTPRDAAFYARQLQILDKFADLNKTGQFLFQAVEASTVDTKRFGNNLVELRRFNKLVDKVMKDNIIKNMDKVFDQTFLKQQYQNSVILGQSVFKDTTVLASDNILALQERIMEEIGRGDDISQDGMAYMNKVSNEIFSSIVGKFFSKDMNISHEDVEKMFYGENNMTSRLNHIKNSKKYEDNPFIKLLQPSMSFDEKTPDHIITFTATDTRTKWAQDRIIDGWAELLTSKDPEAQQFAKDMVPYSFYTSGFNKTMHSLYNFIPPMYLKEIGFSRYMKNVREGFNDPHNYAFTEQIHDEVFRSASWDDDEMVPHVAYNVAGEKRMPKNPDMWGEKYPMMMTLRSPQRVGNESDPVEDLALGYNQFNEKVYAPYIKMEISGEKRLYKFAGHNIDENGNSEPVYVIAQKLGYYKGGKVIKENGLDKSVVPGNQAKEIPEGTVMAKRGFTEKEDGSTKQIYDFRGFQPMESQNMKVVRPYEPEESYGAGEAGPEASAPETVETSKTSETTTNNKKVTVVKGVIKANLIKDKVFSGEAVTTIRNDSYHKTFYKGDGTYQLENNGKLVDIKHIGEAIKDGDVINITRVDGTKYEMSLDEFGKDEGFKNWKGFLKEAKYSDNFISEEKSRQIYSIKPAEEVKAEETTINFKPDNKIAGVTDEKIEEIRNKYKHCK